MARSRASREKSGLRATLRIGASRRAQSSAAFATSRATSCEIATRALPNGDWLSGAIYGLTGPYRAAFLNGIAWNLLNVATAFCLLLSRLRRSIVPAR
jgi:hypothetical protein